MIANFLTSIKKESSINTNFHTSTKPKHNSIRSINLSEIAFKNTFIMPVISTLRTHVDGKAVPAFGETYVKVSSQTPVKARHQAYSESPEFLPIEWINACGGLDAALGKFTKKIRPLIVGAGWAGTRIGLEFAKCGISASIIEARCKCGGRTSAVKGKGQTEYLLGSMRYAPTEGMLFELAYHYGFSMLAGFVDPGVAPTLLAFDKPVERCDPKNIPERFRKVHDGWKAMLENGFQIDGEQFTSFNEITNLLRSHDIKDRTEARLHWQKYIDHFKDSTLKDIMIAIFVTNTKPPGCKSWTMNDLDNIWGKGGIGSGGFGVFFPLCALTIMRFLPNEWEVDQCTFAKKVNGEWNPMSVQKLVEAMLEKAESLGLKVKFETKLVDIRKSTDSDGNPIYIVTVEDEYNKYDIECDLPILAIPPTVIVDLGLAREDLFPLHICKALNNVYMVETTKVFVSIPREYFKNPATARVILGEFFQTYIMDFNDQKNVVGLLDYAWAEHSLRYHGEKDPKKCVAIIKEDIKTALEGSEYAHWLDCLDTIEEAVAIHWEDYKYARGAFTFLKPCQDKYCSNLLHYSGEGGPCITTASATPYDGWIEGAEIKVQHDFAHIAKRYGKVICEDLSPVARMRPFDY